MSFVLDASITIPFLSPDESSAKSDQIFAKLMSTGASVPSLWWLEVSNVMRMKRDNGSVTPAEFDRIIARMAALPLHEDRRSIDMTFSTIAHLAVKHGLTTYDACYLELAIWQGVGIATFDKELIAAAKAENVEVM